MRKSMAVPLQYRASTEAAQNNMFARRQSESSPRQNKNLFLNVTPQGFVPSTTPKQKSLGNKVFNKTIAGITGQDFEQIKPSHQKDEMTIAISKLSMTHRDSIASKASPRVSTARRGSGASHTSLQKHLKLSTGLQVGKQKSAGLSNFNYKKIKEVEDSHKGGTSFCTESQGPEKSLFDDESRKNSVFDNESKNYSPFEIGAVINCRDEIRHEEYKNPKSHFAVRKDRTQVHHELDNSESGTGHEKENIDLDGRYDTEGEQEFAEKESRGVSDDEELFENANQVNIMAKPIHPKGLKRLDIPRFAHELSHQKMFEAKSFERRLDGLSSPKTPKEQTPVISTKAFYYEILKELEQTPLDIKNDNQVSFVLNKAEKVDQMTFSIVEQKLGTRYSQALYRIFTKYTVANGSINNKMNFGRLIIFIKDFGLLNNNLQRENVSLIFTKRCPSKVIDFPAFVDILFKMCQQSQGSESQTERNQQFTTYLDRFVLNQHCQVLERQLSPKNTNIIAFGKEFGPENEALRILEGHDDLLKHMFTLYKSLDIQYSRNSIVKLKDFKALCHDFCIVPVLASLNETSEVFKRFQLGEKPVIEFRGFIMAICSIANIGFEKEAFKQKNDTYSKKLLRFFEMIVDMNSRVSKQLIANDIKKYK